MPDPFLCSVATLKKHLSVPDANTSQDAFYGTLLLELDEVFANVTGRERVPGFHPLQSATATEYHDGTGSDLIALRRRPLTEVVDVWEDPCGAYGAGPDAFTSDPLTLGVNYAPTRTDATEQNGALIRRMCGPWCEGHGAIKVTYTAGYETPPADVTLAICQLAAAVIAGIKKGGLMKSETLGDYTYELMSSTDDPTMIGIRSIFARYSCP